MQETTHEGIPAEVMSGSSCELNKLEASPGAPSAELLAEQPAESPREAVWEFSSAAHATDAVSMAAGGAIAGTVFAMNVVPFCASDQPASVFDGNHMTVLFGHVGEAVKFMNAQASRVVRNVVFFVDTSQRPIRSRQPLAWFQQAHPEVLAFWKPYPQLATPGDIQEYQNNASSRQRWWMNVLADLNGYSKVALGGGMQVVPTSNDAGKSVAVRSRTTVLCAFGTPPNNGGAVAPAGTVMVSGDVVLPPTRFNTGSVIAHEFLHTVGFSHPQDEKWGTPIRDASGQDIDVMSGGMHAFAVGQLAIHPNHLQRLKDNNRSQYRSPYVPHTIVYGQLGTPLPDGDIVNVRVDRNVCPPDKVRIQLAQVNGLTWWKGISLIPRGGGARSDLVQSQDQSPAQSKELSVLALRGQDFILSKAKVLGVHTDMYCIEDAMLWLEGGCSYTFQWAKD